MVVSGLTLDLEASLRLLLEQHHVSGLQSIQPLKLL